MVESRRKLAAILFTDIVGYTGRSNVDEPATLHVRELIETVVRDCAASHNGTFIKSIGDAFMVAFASAVDAVSSAIALQERIADLRTSDGAAAGVQMRIGVHIGDVVEENGDLLGNAVNITQRIQSMAEPGGICISRDVYTQIKPILKLRCTTITSAPEKPLPEPVEVMSVSSETLSSSVSVVKQDVMSAGVMWFAFAVCVGVWLICMPFWAIPQWGSAISGIVLGLAIIPLTYRLATNTPKLNPDREWINAHRGRVGRGLATALVFFALSGATVSATYFTLLDNVGLGGWVATSAPWGSESKYKGKEYHLTNMLPSLKASHPTTAIVSGYDSRFDSRTEFWYLDVIMSGIVSFLFLMLGVCQSYGSWMDYRQYARNREWLSAWTKASMGLAGGLLFGLFVYFAVFDMIIAFNGKSMAPQGGRDQVIKVNHEDAKAAVKRWAAAKGYDLPAFNGYDLVTVPGEKTMAKLMEYRICKPDPNQRWHRELLNWRSAAPFIVVTLLSTEGKPESSVSVDTSGAVIGPQAEYYKSEINSLTDAIKQAAQH